MKLMQRTAIPAILLAVSILIPCKVYSESRSEEIGDLLQYLLPAAGFAGTYVADDLDYDCRVQDQ